MASNECNSTFDCLNVGSGFPRVCYKDVTFSDRKNFCDCSSWYGWTGEECDDASFQVYYSIIMLLFLTLWGVFILAVSGRTLSFHVRNHISTEEKKFNSVFYTGLLVFSGATTLLMYTIINLLPLFDSDLVTPIVYSDFATGPLEDVTAKGGKFAIYCFFGLGTIYTLISAQIILSWYSTIGRIADFYPDVMWFSPETVKRMIQGFVAVELGFTLILMLTDSLAVLYGNVIFLGCLILILYLKGAKKFAEACDIALLRKDTKASSAIWLVKRSCKVHTIFLAVGVCMTLLFTVLQFSVKQDIKPGTFNPLRFCRDIITIIALGMLTFDSWYVHIISKNVLHLEKTIAWLPRSFSRFHGHRRTFRLESSHQTSVVVTTMNSAIEESI